MWGDKVKEDFVGERVTYVIGGRASGIGNTWTNEDWYQEAMDDDNDGVPEFMTDVTGTRDPGWFRVTVNGTQDLEFTYVRSSTIPGLDVEEVLWFTILP